MNLTYAVDRLYEMGWLPSKGGGTELDRLDDGRRFPSVQSIVADFGLAGLKLVIKPNLMFNCYQAAWCPLNENLDPAHEPDDRHGTVIGSCEREAAVYALAQHLSTLAEMQLAIA